MPAIPQGFPRNLSDDDLDAAIGSMLASATVNHHEFNQILPELQLAILNAAMQERSRRITDTAEKRSFWVSVLALVVSLASLSVAVAVVLTA